MNGRLVAKCMACTLLLTLLGGAVGCNMVTSPKDIVGDPRVSVFFNEPGSRQGTERDLMPDQVLIDRIDGARSSIDAGIYGFSNKKILDALIRAHLRGVKVRVAGDARHFGTNERGYRLMQQHHIPIQVGNEYHIMHDKLFIIDNFYVFAGTGNITSTGFERNDNNWVLIEHPEIAKRFKVEFEQMFDGKFSTAKKRQSDSLPSKWTVGNTVVEVYFSPEDDTMGRMLQELEKVDTNIYFTIFAFTKDQIGSTMIRKHRQFQKEMTEEERKRPPFSADSSDPVQPKVVTGILDRSQVQGNYLYHEVYRLISNGVPMMIDANENSYLPGDYQAGGGRLHSKTMILDRGTPNARVITGSFNWSSAATIANDEFLLILRGEEIAEQYYNAYRSLWLKSKDADVAICNYYDRKNRDNVPLCSQEIKSGDVVISEVHWAGWNGLMDQSDHTGSVDRRRRVLDDEFIELYNTTDRPIDLSLWTISNDSDFKIGFTPGTVIQPKQYFLVLDHNTAQYSDTKELSEADVAFLNPDFVINSANDPRFPRLNLADEKMGLRLKSATGELIDQAGDDGLPFAGKIEYTGKEVSSVSSMERVIRPDGTVADGTKQEGWKTCRATGGNVAEAFKSKIIATPGQANSQ